MSGNVARRLSAAIWAQSGTSSCGAFRQSPPSLWTSKATSTTKFQSSILRHISKPPCSFRWHPSHVNTVRSFASGGFFAIGLSPRTIASEPAAAACTNTLEKSLGIEHNSLDRRKCLVSLHSNSRRFAHTKGTNARDVRAQNESAGFKPKDLSDSRITDSETVQDPGKTQEDLQGRSQLDKHATSSYTAKILLDRLPTLPHLHRPSKEELLAAATGFWSRLKIRFKWFSIRSVRPFNADDISAFFSWILLGHVLWIILGTTTFFSLAIFAVNTVFAQETLAKWVGNYLTKSTGIKIVFESAIVPKWGDGVITLKNVFVSRRPGQGMGRVTKGSPGTAAAAAAATVTADAGAVGSTSAQEEEDTNYTQFDISFETVNVTLSFTKWFNSKGLLRDVEVKGVRGVIDRTHLHYPGYHIDPRSYKHEHNPGDFEIESFKMEDLLVTVHQPGGFRPFSVSIFSCDLPQLRKQWLFYDFLSANMMSGSFDNSLFTIHPHQIHGQLGSPIVGDHGTAGESSPWKKHSRLRIDGLSIDHLNRGVSGPFSWIHEGDVDIVADIMFPTDNDESIAKVMSDFYDRMEATVTSRDHVQERDGITISNDQINDFEQRELRIKTTDPNEDRKFIVMDLRVHLNDVRAAVPLFTKDLSYVNNALIRPIVAYINSRNTFIPINCRVVKRVTEFDGSWTIFDSGLMDDLSAETYTAFAKDVTDDQARLRRFKKVGLWSLQLAVQALFMGMAGNIA